MHAHALFPQSGDCQAGGGHGGRLALSCSVYPLRDVTLISQKHSLTGRHRALLREPSPADRPAGGIWACLPDLLGEDSLASYLLFCLHRPQCWGGLSTMHYMCRTILVVQSRTKNSVHPESPQPPQDLSLLLPLYSHRSI